MFTCARIAKRSLKDFSGTAEHIYHFTAQFGNLLKRGELVTEMAASFCVLLRFTSLKIVADEGILRLFLHYVVLYLPSVNRRQMYIMNVKRQCTSQYTKAE